MSNYAYKTPDGMGIFRVVLNSPLEDPAKTIDEADLWPVEPTIPQGKQQDFASGEKGWYLDAGIVRPCLKDIEHFVPSSIPRFKLRLWLNQAGMLDAVESMINDAARWPDAKSQKDALILWNERPDVRRDSALVAALGAALGMSAADIDTAFIAANAME